ncbi:precorrin-6Y C5,15-methyltransferase (decarboxylating) subunit CbiT [Alkalibacter mobilis]|uniref:precorrin-6Y C5,15-methyltransferase (decarboxylating) subunit CbiT n=1 Tax=Alkalibacter mobilis TaxID=2787712 RepID=UPI00189D2717|nr:precorrin-6Y C5,15-methyltransferase (decarboxylating) subunit CbiT [Alkalibacter mobilis]MBF7097174.1 precorrin-6Y C5,15-methyltransferase (decarboxylating) subunit CbiT [Alkalibacter mobilis]
MKLNYIGGIPDDMFIRGDVPMTKEEIRTITLSKIKINDGDTIVDIGAGTGSITIEAALLCPAGKVYAIEQNSKAVEIIEKNIEKFKVKNVKVIQDMAPSGLENLSKVNCVIVGGSKGNLNKIIEWSTKHLDEDGRIVGNFIVLENSVEFIKLLKENGFQCEIVNVCLSKGREIGGKTMMEGLNPISIVTGKKTKNREVEV